MYTLKYTNENGISRVGATVHIDTKFRIDNRNGGLKYIILPKRGTLTEKDDLKDRLILELNKTFSEIKSLLMVCC